jgi:hypothetical protein
VFAALLRLISLLVLTVAASAPAQEQDGGLLPPEQLRVRVTPERVKLGEPVTLEIVVTHDPTQRYELKTPSDLGDFDYLGQERSRVDGKDQSTTTILVKVAAFQLGALDTPQLDLEVSAPEGNATLPIPRAKVNVDSTLPADAQTKGENLYDVKPPEEVPIRSWRLLYVLAALLALAGVAYAIVRYVNRPKVAVPAYVPPPEPLHVRATKALDTLAAENLPAKGEFKSYYFRLSEIVRGYLGELYAFEALESTTPELLNALRSRSTPGLPMPDLTTFAEASDYIRYARQLPSVDDCKTHLELAYRIIHSTQAAIVPPKQA